MRIKFLVIRSLIPLFTLGLAVLLIAAVFVSSAAPAADVQPALPIRAAFYYPWFPEAWKQQGVEPYTNYHPTLGYYNLSDQAVMRQHIAAMQYGGVQAGIASWWGQGSATDQRMPGLLSAAAGTPFRWSIYYEPESQGDPSVNALTSDLVYLRDHYGADPSYLRINGRFVVFVYADAGDGCGMVDRWQQANTVNAYIVLKVFGGYRSCAHQPDGWHQYGPASAADAQVPFSYSISPGFYKVGESPRLGRDLARWKSNIRDMVASGAAFQLITTFNEWGEGTAVESAQEWSSPSGYGAYLDALHNNGQDGPVIAPTTVPTAASASTLTFPANADARVEEAHPTTNYGAAITLRVDKGSGVGLESYLRFVVSNVSSNVLAAKLRVYATTNATADGPAVYATSGNWSETAITWQNRPAHASVASDNKGAIGTSSWVDYNVTPLVTGNGTYNFALVADSADGATFSSREGGTPPQLVLTLSAPSTTAPTSQPAATPAPTNPPAATPVQPGSPTATPAAGQAIKTVFVIVMENHNWADIKGSASAPYINGTLLPMASFAQQYYNPPGIHPSEPNYLWLEAGTGFGITNDSAPSTNHQSTTSHLVTLLKNAGISWKAYQEGISGTSCPLTGTGLYAPKHNPMVFFDDVTGTNNPSSAYCIAHERPYTELATDLQANTVARYNFITPDLCDDMHNSSGCATSNSIKNGDTWLSKAVPQILGSQAYKNGGALFITWDEGEGSDGPIGMIVLSPSAKGGGYSNTVHYTHSSTLRTIQEIFGVTPLLGDAAKATDLSDLFKVFP